ncbi:MAG: hypothetical protein ACRDHW_00395 [Ktedonobacteraceae bacterium]
MSAGESAPEDRMEMPRKTRRDKGKRQLTPRDLWVLPWIASQYAIRFDQLQELLSREPGQRNKKVTGPGGITDSAVDQVVERWEEDPAFVVYERPHRHTPGWIWLTPYGERALDLHYKRHLLSERTLTHKYYINQVRLDYERRHPEYRWVSERDLQVGLPRRKRGERVGHISDGEIWLPTGKPIAVEVELYSKPDEVIDRYLNEMLAGADAPYRAVLYFVTGSKPRYAQAWRDVEKARVRLAEGLQLRMQIIPLEKVGTDDTATPESTITTEEK